MLRLELTSCQVGTKTTCILLVIHPGSVCKSKMGVQRTRHLERVQEVQVM